MEIMETFFNIADIGGGLMIGFVSIAFINAIAFSISEKKGYKLFTLPIYFLFLIYVIYRIVIAIRKNELDVHSMLGLLIWTLIFSTIMVLIIDKTPD